MSLSVYNKCVFHKLKVCELTLGATLKEHTNYKYVSWTLFCFCDILLTKGRLILGRYGHDATSHTSSGTTEGLAQCTTITAGSKYHTHFKQTQLLPFPHSDPFIASFPISCWGRLPEGNTSSERNAIFSGAQVEPKKVVWAAETVLHYFSKSSFRFIKLSFVQIRMYTTTDTGNVVVTLLLFFVTAQLNRAANEMKQQRATRQDPNF